VQVNDEVIVTCIKLNNISNDRGNKPEDQKVKTDEQCAEVQTRVMVAKESKPSKHLKVKSISGLDIGSDELKAKEKADTTTWISSYFTKYLSACLLAVLTG